MMKKQASVIILFYLVGSTLCIQLYRYKTGFIGDEAIVNNQLGGNDATGCISLDENHRFYGEDVNEVMVSIDGAVFFNKELFSLCDQFDFDTSYVSNQHPFPLGGGRKFLAPFWADADTTGTSGSVWFRKAQYETESDLFNKTNEQIRRAFPLQQPSFTTTHLSIFTWEKVGYYNKKKDKENTFQCVLANAKSGSIIYTYAIFLYPSGGIQWTTGDNDNGTNGLFGYPAQVGFNKGDGIHAGIIGASGTDNIIDIPFTSNVGEDGVYIFEISNEDVSVETTCTDNLTGTPYDISDSYERDCTRCTCRNGGQFDCIKLLCAIDGPTCYAYGDPHYITFDGKPYGYQGPCQYVFAERCTSYSEFSIKTRNKRFGSVSYVREVTIETPGVNITLGHGRPVPVKVNGKSKDFLGTVYETERVTVNRHVVTSNVYVTTAAIAFRVIWDGEDHIRVKVSKSLQNKLCGLCGTYNGNPNDDMRKRDGTQETLVNKFGDSWLVPGSCIDSRKRDAPEITGCSTDPAVIEEGKSKCGVLMGEVFSICNSFVNPAQFIENCEFDYRCCDDSNREVCYCSVLASYAAACADVGVTLSTWRNSYCPLECPAGMVYLQCGSFCPPTCDNLNAIAMCEAGCSEGCFCPDGQVLLDGKCVDPFICTACTYMDVIYQEGEQIQPNCSTRCTCRKREFQCKTQPCLADGSTCLVAGNSHYQTFDLSYYEFQGDCEYILTTPCQSDEFTITVANIAHDDFMSSVYQVTISIPDINLKVVLGRGSGGSVTINGILQPNVGDGKIMQSDELEIIRAGGHPHILLIAHHVKVFWNGLNRVQVTAGKVWEDKLCGLCGHYNNDASDDFMTPSGQLVYTENEFSNSWVINNNISTCGLLHSPPYCLENVRTQAINYCLTLRNGVFLSCNSLLNPIPYIRNCVYDSCYCNETNRQECFCESLATYAAACTTVGATISNWRDLYCSAQCSENMIYHQCGSLCSETCADTITTCHSGCAEGCFCLDGYVVDHDGRCRSSCPSYTTEGDEFYVGFFKNRFGRSTDPETIPPVLWVTTQEFTPVHFTVSTKAGVLTESQAFPGSTTFINTPLNLIVFDSTQSNVTERFKGISIKAESGKKIAVFGQNEQLASNDAFLALPVNPIPRERRHEYILVSVHGDSGTAIQSKDSVALIVGTQDKTEITILPSTTTGSIRNNLAPRGFFSKTFDDSLNTITIDQYQTFYLQARGKDISGTRVISNKPIAVFSGHECANIPLNSEPCDMLVEQIPPIDTWGTVVVTTPFKTRKDGDLIKVIASQDSTTVFVTKTDTVNGKVSNIPAFTLNAGEYKELLIKEFSIIRSNNPIAVFHFSRSYRSDNVINSDPFMVFVPPDEQYLNSYAISTAPFNPQLKGSVIGRTAYVNYTNIAVPAKYFNTSLLTINNQTTDATDFKPIRYSDGSVWGYGAQLMLNAGAQVVKHQDPNATFLLTVYGFSNQMSYGYTGGSKLESYIPARPCNVRPIVGSVAISTGTVEITFVADDSGATFRCKLDKTRFVKCTSPWTQMNVAEGDHEITIEAKCPNDGKKIKRKFKFKVD